MSAQSTTQYVYRVNGNDSGLFVSVAIADPSTSSGARFGFDAEVTAYERFGSGELEVKVSQGSIGAVADAVLLNKVRAAAIVLATEIELRITAGEGPRNIASDLQGRFEIAS